jgi:hypothetical protein
MSETATKSIEKLAERIKRSRPGQEPITTNLATSDRVLRRVTDGIYREPWSALREIVSNAYDADATEVVIDTDAPRFHEIRIRDNGNGFTAEALASMVKSIGGSTKRTEAGADLGVTAQEDYDRSPGGRKLIGKLGIGLFAVSQLTQEFQVITKRRSETERTVADVLLFRYAEGKHSGSGDSDAEFHTGSVRIWKMPVKDKNSHGTEIVLRNLLPRTKAELCSTDTWTLIFAPAGTVEPAAVPLAPLYHIGYVDPENPDELKVAPKSPWGRESDPDKRFRLFAEKMFEREHVVSERRPSLENTFDNYLKFIWFLSLSAPLDYLNQHPFDLDSSSGLRIYQLSNGKSGSAQELELKPGQTVREALNLKSPERGSKKAFRVIVDGVSLRRPIRFTGLPKASHSVDRPLLLVGKDRPDLSKYPESVRGGDLEFEGYLLWSPRVVPVEHNGVLVRINDASGTLFDETFMKYQVSEQTRMRQVSSELFVTEGLDAALNIDRESFNVAHPHYQYVSSWLHGAFRQFATRQKDLAKAARSTRIATGYVKSQKELSSLVAKVVDDWSDGDDAPVKIEFVPGLLPRDVGDRPKDSVSYSLEKIFEGYELGARSTNKKALEFAADQATMKAVAQVLYAAGVFDKMSHEKQERLLSDLAAIIFLQRGVNV